jgi:N-acetylmuramoyl-L-alanine amidase
MSFFLLFISFFFSLNFFSKKEIPPKAKLKKIVLDAGHGGKDPGASGKSYKEKNITLGIALEVGKLINKNFPGIEVVYTRKTDIFVPLDERADIANKAKADLFISIHANSSPNKSITGTETYVMGMHKSQENLDVAMRENEVITQEEDYKAKYNFDPKSQISYIKLSVFQSVYQENSLHLAYQVEKSFTASGRVSRGVKQSGFLVLWKTAMPGILIETGYVSNRNEELMLGTVEGQRQIAKNIFEGLKKYKEKFESN